MTRPQPVGARRTAHLTPAEIRVLALMAEGRSNAAIADELVVSVRTVEAHIGSIFRKLGIEDAPSHNRRVAAVVWYLNGEA